MVPLPPERPPPHLLSTSIIRLLRLIGRPHDERENRPPRDDSGVGFPRIPVLRPLNLAVFRGDADAIRSSNQKTKTNKETEMDHDTLTKYRQRVNRYSSINKMIIFTIGGTKMKSFKLKKLYHENFFIV